MSVPTELLDREAALTYLMSRIDYERSDRLPFRSQGLKLDRMRELLTRLGNPDRRFPIVHVAGTKGKGSTSAMIAAILSAAGYRTGLYTSPHLESVEERLNIDGRICSGDAFADLVGRIRPHVETMDARAEAAGQGEKGPTFFEITTAAAALHFADSEVNAAVFEVGLGGRLDSTNACHPEITVITSISFDHMRQLGNTLAAIAAEKAGIIKPGVPLITGVTHAEPLDVILQIATANQSDCQVLGRDFHFRYRGSTPLDQATSGPSVGSRFDYCDGDAAADALLQELPLGLLGRHQVSNAAIAIATVRQLQRQGWRISPASIRAGLANVRIAARAELVSRQPAVVLDVAHNPASIAALLETLDEFLPGRRRILVFAASHDKDAAAMLQMLLRGADTLVLTRFQHNPRGIAPEQLADLAARLASEQGLPERPVFVRSTPAEAWQTARELAAEQDMICITGSFFLAAELRSQVRAMNSEIEADS